MTPTWVLHVWNKPNGWDRRQVADGISPTYNGLWAVAVRSVAAGVWYGAAGSDGENTIHAVAKRCDGNGLDVSTWAYRDAFADDDVAGITIHYAHRDRWIKSAPMTVPTLP